MKKKIKDDSGITLVALVVTVIVMLMIASISVVEGRKMITKSKMQTEETNMLMIQAKAKAYMEDIEAKIWTESGSDKDDERDEEFEDRGMVANTSLVTGTMLSQVNSDMQEHNIQYLVTDEGLENMSLSNLAGKGKQYVVIFESTELKLIDVINIAGITYNDTIYYSLSKLQEVLESNN